MDLRAQPWYNGAIIHDGPAWTPMYVGALSRAPSLSAVAPIVVNGERIGVVAAEYAATGILPFIATSTDAGAHGRVAVLELATGLVLAININHQKTSAFVPLTSINDATIRTVVGTLPLHWARNDMRCCSTPPFTYEVTHSRTTRLSVRVDDLVHSRGPFVLLTVTSTEDFFVSLASVAICAIISAIVLGLAVCAFCIVRRQPKEKCEASNNEIEICATTVVVPPIA